MYNDYLVYHYLTTRSLHDVGVLQYYNVKFQWILYCMHSVLWEIPELSSPVTDTPSMPSTSKPGAVGGGEGEKERK